MTKETKVFETEVQQVLDLMIHSLYSQREIFLRELISNSSDALDKLRYEEIVNKTVTTSDAEKVIKLTRNTDDRTLTITDNGIGMSYDEVVKNIGTIAYSGTKKFISQLKEKKDQPQLIGQFGVGFYSAFMVADRITLKTKRPDSDEQIIWESSCDGKYTIERQKTDDKTCGTSITLHLKSQDKDEDGFQDFLDQWTVKSLVKKYSDFIEYPIKMDCEKEEPDLDSEGKAIPGKYHTEVKEETLNSRKALWLRAPKDITEDEYKDFYKHLTSDWSEPLDRIHYKAEGTQEFSALMYIPSTVPFDYNQREMKYGLNLYVKRVFILNNCEQLVPQHLRFMKGLVDSNDLPLNVSREMVQQDRQIIAIRKALVNKIMKHLATMLEKEPEKYEKFWKNFGATLKEGIATDYASKEKILDLILVHTSASDKQSTLAQYVERMPEGQKSIYYMTGDSIKHLETSPYLEKLKEKKYEVIYFIDAVDEWVLNSIGDYKEKKFVSVTKEGLDLDSDVEKEEKEQSLKEQSERFKSVTESIKAALSENIKDVKISDRLVDSPACLVSGANDPSAHMEKMMESLGHDMPKSKRILEINPKHPIFEKMLGLKDDSRSQWAQILYGQALINEGSPLDNPSKFTKQISDLMLSASL